MATYEFSQIEAWIQTYAPRLIFHPDETYFPCSAEWFMDRTCLEERGGDDSTDTEDCPNQSNLGQVCPSSDYSGDYATLSKCSYFDIPDQDLPVTAQGHLETAKCYVHVLGYSNQNYIDLQYLFLEAFNGGAHARFDAKWYGKSSVVDSGPKGSHQGDWEHITVRISTTGTFIAAFYGQHTHGNWYTSPQLVSGHPVVYVALSTHASYASEGVFTLYRKDSTGTLTDPSVDAFGVRIGGADLTGSGTTWDTWNAIQILEIDGLDVTGEQPPSPDWLDFKGMWGGPYYVDYGTWQTIKIISEFAIAWMKANPIVAGIVGAAIIPLLITIYVSSGIAGVAVALAGLLGISSIAIVIAMLVLWQTEFKSETSMGPAAPIMKSYWNNGESIPYNTGVTTLQNGSTKVNIKFSPGRTIFNSVHYALYSDRNNKFWYHTSADSVSWSGRKQISGTEVHSSPVPVVHQVKGRQFMYVFSQGSKAAIQYNLFNGATWTLHSVPGKMIANMDLSVTVRENTLYLVYRNTDNSLSMKAGAIDEAGAVTWTDVKVDPSMVALDTDPCIATFDESLFLTYKKSGSSDLWQGYSVVTADDGAPGGELRWGGPSTFSSTDLPSNLTPQPVVVDDRLLLLFPKSNAPSNAVTNIYAAPVTASDAKEHTYALGTSFSLGVSMTTDHRMGWVSGADRPLYLAIRKSSNDYHLYLSESYI